MTGPIDQTTAHDPSRTPQEPADRPSRPGTTTFTIEGRAAPGLFVLGWLATLVGLGAVLVAVMSRPGGAGLILLFVGLAILAVGLVAGAGGQAIERRARGARAYTGPSPFLVFAAGIPITALVGIAIGAILGVVGIPVDGPLARVASVVIQTLIYVGLIKLLVVDTGGLSWSGMGVTRPTPGTLSSFALGVAWALPVFAATVVAVAILTAFIPARAESPLPPAGEPAGFALNLLAGVIVAPIGEEIMFRAFATTAWIADMGVARAVVRGAIFFAAVHIIGLTGVEAGQATAAALVAFIARIPVALALGWLFVRTRTIWAPLGLHAAFNGILLVLAELAYRAGVAPA